MPWPGSKTWSLHVPWTLEGAEKSHQPTPAAGRQRGVSFLESCALFPRADQRSLLPPWTPHPPAVHGFAATFPCLLAGAGIQAAVVGEGHVVVHGCGHASRQNSQNRKRCETAKVTDYSWNPSSTQRERDRQTDRDRERQRQRQRQRQRERERERERQRERAFLDLKAFAAGGGRSGVGIYIPGGHPPSPSN